MKFSCLALVATCTLSTLSYVTAIRGLEEHSEANNANRPDDRRQGPAGERRVLKNGGGAAKVPSQKGKGHSSGRPCPTCAETLPGYSLFGKNYLDKNFWENALEKLEADNFETSTVLPTGACFDYSPSSSCGPNTAKYGEDYLIPGPFGISTQQQSCYDDEDNFLVCLLVAGLAELLYANDLFRCLLTSLVTTVRDLTCLEKLELPDGDRRRQLESGVGGPTVLTNEDLLLSIPSLTGWTSFEDIESFFGLDIGKDLLGMEGSTRRQLEPSIRGSGDTAEDLVNDILPLDEILDAIYRDSDNVQAIRGNLFLLKCQSNGLPLGLCTGLFALLKTIDASVCYYRKELGCGADTCNKDLAFDIAYNTERLVVDLPLGDGPASLIIADILSPCDACILEESGGCSAFCGLFESYHTCDNVNAVLDNVRDDIGESIIGSIADFL